MMANLMQSSNADNLAHKILTCYGCSQHTNSAIKRFLKCKHYFCANCMDRFKKITCQENDAIVGSVCPLCNTFHTPEEITAIPEEIMRILHDKYAGIYQTNHESAHAGESKETDCESSKLFLPTELDCKSHPGQKRELLCLDCNKTICFECKVDSHKDHNTDTISESISNYCQKVEPILGEINLCIELQKHQASILTKQDLTIKNNQKTTKAQIQAHKDNIIHEFTKAVNSKFEEMANEIDQQVENQILELQSLKLSIEHSIKSEESIMNWVKFIQNDSPQSFIVEEMRNGLCERLEELNLSAPKFEAKKNVITNQFVPQKIEIPQNIVLGQLKTQQEPVVVESPYLSRRNHTGSVNYRKVQTNLRTLSAKIGRVEKTVKVSTDSCRLCVFHEKFWIPCPETSSINVFPVDRDAESFTTIMDLGDVSKPRSLYPTSRDLLVLAADSGLYLLNDKGHLKEKIHGGNFCDVFANDSQIAALEWQEKKLYIWSQNQLFQAKRSFNVDLGSDNDFSSTVCIHNAYLYISNGTKDSILKYNMQGTLVEEFGVSGKTASGELNMPYLCAVDPTGDFLVADSGNHRLQVLSGSGKWSALRLKIFKPRDVVIIRSTMYILHSEGNKISIYPL